MKLEQRHLTTYQDLFVTRADIHARQNADGSYHLRRERVTDQLLTAHLAGRATVGLYGLGALSRAKWLAVDADGENGLDQLQQVYKELESQNLPAQLEQSRRGGHLWLFLDAPLPGAELRRLVKLAAPSAYGLELYPKQDKLERTNAVGSLIRGPLGIHRLSGSRYPFLDPVSLRMVSPTVLGTIDYLAEAERIPRTRVSEILSQAPKPAPLLSDGSRATRSGSPVSQSVIEQVRAATGDPYSFLSRYLDLDPSGKAHCPFHKPDTHKSFAVDPKTGRWTYFHEYNEDGKHYLSGDNLDFYMRLTGLSCKDAIHRLLS
jgi:hypothetical protein